MPAREQGVSRYRLQVLDGNYRWPVSEPATRSDRGAHRRCQHTDQQTRGVHCNISMGSGQKASEIMEKVRIPDVRQVSQLTDQEVLRILEMIDRDYMVEGDLRRRRAMNIKRLMDLGCYRGCDIAAGFPCVASAPMQCPPQGSGQGDYRQKSRKPGAMIDRRLRR